MLRDLALLLAAGGVLALPQNTEGLRLVDSTATIITSLVLGADHAPHPANHSPKPAVTLQNSTMRLGPGAAIVGGAASGGGNAASYLTAGTSPTAVYKDFRAYIHSLQLTPMPVPQDLHATMHNVVDANAPFDLVVAGPPGGFALLAIGNYAHPSHPTPLGALALEPSSVTVLLGGALDPLDGELAATLFCPPGVPHGQVFALQSAVLAPNGALSLTALSPLVVGWQFGLAP